MNDAIVTAHTTCSDGREVVEALTSQIGSDPQAIVFFHGATIDGHAISRGLRAAYREAVVIGASTCGEFTNQVYGRDGVAALAFGRGVVERCAGAIADFEHGVDRGIHEATQRLAADFGSDLRALDPTRCVGVVLLEATGMHEEAANHALGREAPLLSFVGGSAGDGLTTPYSNRVHHGDRTSGNGASLLLLETARPFHILKTTNYEPTDREFVVTRAEPGRRIIRELDGRPAAEVYAECLDVPVAALGAQVFMNHPIGLMIDGEPWLRSLSRVIDGNALMCACEVIEGMRVSLMRGRDMVADTASALDRAAATLGTPISGGLMFNCVYRMMELQMAGQEEPYAQLLRRFPLAGMQTMGESWLGHMNQTLTAVLFG